MKTAFTACALLTPLVMGFGADVEGDNACEQCVCANDPGEMYDPSNGKCCPARGATPDEWDGFCDATALIECKEVCADSDGHALTELLPHLADHSSVVKSGHSGDICGRRTFEGNDHDDNDDTPAGCGEGLFCVRPSPDSDLRVCSTLHGALESLADADEGGKLLTDLTPDDFSADMAYGFAHNEPLTDEQRAALKAKLVERLGLTEEQTKALELKVSELPVRRQRGMPFPYYTQPTMSSGSSGGSCTAGCACNSMSSSSANQVVSKLEQLGVAAICWDYDLTASTVHTYSKSYGSWSELTGAISKNFVAVAEAWCQKKPNTQGICTYSNAQTKNYVAGKSVPGTQQISEVLSKTLSKSCYNQFKNKIFGKNNSGNRSQPGKSYHLQQFKSSLGGRLSNKQIMLIDDTADNINVALRDGYQTDFVTPAKGYCASSARTNSQASSNPGSW